jgi:hypothetical protein
MHEHGYLIISSPAGTLEADTLQCCHCNAHYVVRPGSGKRRGFCTLCSAVTCGAPACAPCVPFEKKLDEFERRERLMAHLRS